MCFELVCFPRTTFNSQNGKKKECGFLLVVKHFVRKWTYSGIFCPELALIVRSSLISNLLKCFPECLRFAPNIVHYSNDSIPVYHCCTTDFNPLSLQILANIGQKVSRFVLMYSGEPIRNIRNNLNFWVCNAIPDGATAFSTLIHSPGFSRDRIVSSQVPCNVRRTSHGRILVDFATTAHVSQKKTLKNWEKMYAVQVDENLQQAAISLRGSDSLRAILPLWIAQHR